MILRRDPVIKIGYDDAGWVSNRGILSHPLRQLTAVDRRADRSANQVVIEWRLSQVQVEHDGVTGSKPRVIVLWILRAKHGIAVGTPTDTRPVKLAFDHIGNAGGVVFDRGNLDRLDLWLCAPVTRVHRIGNQIGTPTLEDIGTGANRIVIIGELRRVPADF